MSVRTALRRGFPILLTLHSSLLQEFTFMSGGSDNIKKWQCRDGKYDPASALHFYFPINDSLPYR